MNYSLIFATDSTELVDFICECIEDTRVKKALQSWPNELKIKIVEKHLLTTDLLNSFAYCLKAPSTTTLASLDEYPGPCSSTLPSFVPE